MPVLYPFGTKVPGSVYRIDGVVALGASSIIYDVWDTVLSVRRALKMLDPGRGPDFDRRMLREWQMLAGLDHPHIVRVHAANRTADQQRLPYFVMDWLQGQDLRRWLGQVGHFGVERAIGIAIDMLWGLAAAHDRRILHRDIKPENTFLSRAPAAPWYEVKLLDFGCARWMHAPSSGALVGTLNYLAPELLEGHPPSERSDIYAVGVTLYEMLAGAHPFPRQPTPGRRWPEPLARVVNAPPELSALVDEALAPSPELRVPTARAFASRLGQVGRCWTEERAAIYATTEHDMLIADRMPSTQRMPTAPPRPDAEPPSSRRF